MHGPATHRRSPLRPKTWVVHMVRGRRTHDPVPHVQITHNPPYTWVHPVIGQYDECECIHPIA